MRAFVCGHCGLLITFESSSCMRCGSQLGFAWPAREPIASPAGTLPRCANRARAGCNWTPGSDGELCFSCSLTRTRPADADVEALGRFARAEAAKRRLLFELGELGLPIPRQASPSGPALAFDFLSSSASAVTTGHADGLITLDLAEADDAERIRLREQLDEPYRTVLGHLRHEIGHFYFPILCPDEARLARARELFGDEREDYQAALARHYESGAPRDWQQRHVSAYATMHPMEDWAETFAHVLHIRDTLQTAAAHGLQLNGPGIAERAPSLSVSPEDVEEAGLRRVIGDWLALSYALNAINRSMGHDDLYPFVLSPRVIDKLAAVDELIGSAADAAAIDPAVGADLSG
jgi:hypothetical protein